MIRPVTDADAAAAERLVDEVLGSRWQARLDDLIDVLALPGLGAWDGQHLVGIATYSINGSDTEVAALAVREDHRGRGLAGRLLDAVIAAATTRGAHRVWVVTTNDNLTALAVYQRYGFRLAEIRPGAIDRARTLKPTIPEIGQNRIPMHDEIILERHDRRDRRDLPRMNPTGNSLRRAALGPRGQAWLAWCHHAVMGAVAASACR